MVGKASQARLANSEPRTIGKTLERELPLGIGAGELFREVFWAPRFRVQDKGVHIHACDRLASVVEHAAVRRVAALERDFDGLVATTSEADLLRRKVARQDG